MKKFIKNKKWIFLSSILIPTIIATPLIAAACAKRVNEVVETNFYVNANQKYFINLLVEINQDQNFENLKQNLEKTKFEIFVYDGKQQTKVKINDLKPMIEKTQKNFNNKKAISLFLELNNKPTADHQYVIVANENIKSIKITTLDAKDFSILELKENLG